MLVVNRFVLDADAGQGTDVEGDLMTRAREALAALAASPGFVRGEIGRAYDDPAYWILATEWESVGAYRRALGRFDVRVGAAPLLADSQNEPSAYETLARTAGDGAVTTSLSDRSRDPAADR